MTDRPGVRGGRLRATAALLALLLPAAGLVACSEGGEPAERSDPGTLLADEPLDAGLPDGVQGWRIRYATTGSDGEPREATGLVLAPAEPERRGPVLAVAHPTTGIATGCAPSASGLAGLGVAAATPMVRRGWVAVATDYAGLGTPGPHEYLVGEAAAHDVLDSVRAVRQLVPEADEETVLWGHSQGGHAVLWAGAEAPSYAPDVEVAGVVAVAPPTDLRALVPRIQETVGGTLVAALVLAAWDRLHPDAGILRAVPQRLRPAVRRIGETCLQGFGSVVASGLAEQLQGRLLPERAYDGPLGALLRENTPAGPIEAPVLVAQGREDVLVPAEVTRAWVDRRCAAGQALDYREYAGRGHGSLLGPGSPLARELPAWLEARADGRPARDTCR